MTATAMNIAVVFVWTPFFIWCFWDLISGNLRKESHETNLLNIILLAIFAYASFYNIAKCLGAP